jgi:hypothetical protein
MVDQIGSFLAGAFRVPIRTCGYQLDCFLAQLFETEISVRQQSPGI